MLIQFLAAILAAILFVPALQAQQVVGGPDLERKASTLFVFNDTFEALAGVSISYSQPTWQDTYNGMLEKLQGNYTRLGKHELSAPVKFQLAVAKDVAEPKK